MRILSLNGGGTCGYMTASLLDKIETEIKHPSYELFDLMTGVSTGSIIVGFLGKGVAASELKNLYKQLATDIFSKKNWIPWKPWYSIDELYNIASAHLCYPFNKSKTKTMILATKISTPKYITSKFWKSWKEDDTIMTHEVVVSSCAAPIYFAPHEYQGVVYVDGGFSGNNPSMHSIAEALSMGGVMDNMYNLNIGCGRGNGLDNAMKFSNILKWIPQISDLVTLSVRAGELASEYHSHQLLGFRNHVVQPEIDLDLATLDFATMDAQVDKMWETHHTEIISQLQLAL